MKAIVTGVQRNSGIRKADQAPFDSCSVDLLVPLQPVTTPNFQRKAYGFESKTMPLEVNAFSKFAKYLDKFPLELELETGTFFNRDNQAMLNITGIVEA